MVQGKTVTVQVGFNQQQRLLLENLKAEGLFGNEDGEVIRRVFAEWLKEEGLR